MKKIHELLKTINNILIIPALAIIGLSFLGYTPNISIIFSLSLSLLFFSEWTVGLLLSEDKTLYLKNPYNLADLLSSIPVHPSFAGVRIIRAIRIVKVASLTLRARKVQRRIFPLIKVSLIVVSMTMTSAFVLEQIEPQIYNGKSPYWETFQTLVTGEFSTPPETEQGRFAGSLIMILGIGVFGYAAGFASSILDDSDEREIEKNLINKIGSIEAKIDYLINN